MMNGYEDRSSCGFTAAGQTMVVFFKGVHLPPRPRGSSLLDLKISGADRDPSAVEGGP